MRLAIRSMFVTLLVLSGPPAVRGQETRIAQEAGAALHYYLTVGCEVGADGLARAALLTHAELLEPMLRRVLRSGPNETLRIENQQVLEAEWDRREAFLSTNPQLGLSPNHLLAVHSVGREDYLEQGAARFTRGCRERAILGLVTIGSPTALQTLGEAEEEVDGELGGLIQAALEAADSARTEKTGRLHQTRTGPPRPTR